MLNKARILCVDDDPKILRSLKWVLERDYEVLTAESGESALRVIQHHDFEVVISDQRMPGMMGADFLDVVRQIRPRTIRILLTGYSDIDALLDSINKGEIFRFIKKPWDIPQLKRIVAEAVNISRGLENDDEIAEVTQDEPQILIIEEDQDVIDLVKDIVGDPGRTLVAYNIAQAIIALEQSDRIGVIVSDLYLGKVDISRLLKTVKNKVPEITSVVVSSRIDAQEVIDLINQGQVYRFIFKPAKRGALKLLIQSALDKHLSLKSSPASKQQYRVEKLNKAEIDSLIQDARKQAKQDTLPEQYLHLHKEGMLQRFTHGLARFLGG